MGGDMRAGMCHALFLAAASFFSGREDYFAFYALSTALGMHAWAPAHRSAAAFWNALFHRSLLDRVEDFRMNIFQSGAAERTAP